MMLRSVGSSVPPGLPQIPKSGVPSSWASPDPQQCSAPDLRLPQIPRSLKKLSSQIPSDGMLLVGFPALGGFPVSGDSQIPGPAQLPMGSPAPRNSPAPGPPQIPKNLQLPVGSAAPKAFPKDPPNPWGVSAPCESPVPGKLWIPGHAQLPEGPNSPGTPSSLGDPQIPVELQLSGNPQLPGGSGSSAPALLGFCPFCSCCCNKKWERQ